MGKGKKRTAVEIAKSKAPAAKKSKAKQKLENKDMNRYVNKQRTLVFSTRGIMHRDRHFMKDLKDLLPHSKGDTKLDAKDKLYVANEVCEMKNCNNCVLLEARKHKDLYMWVSKAPNGPSMKMLVQNVHTMSEVKLTGNCLKGARPLLVFDETFDSDPHYRLIKEMFIQTFGSPKGHPKTKPFVDHVFSFFVADNRIWFRNYQIVYDPTTEGSIKKSDEAKPTDPVLVEIGPRFVMNPVRIFSGSFSGTTLWENPHYVSPNAMRAANLRAKAMRYDDRTVQKAARKDREAKERDPVNPLDDIFMDEVQQKNNKSKQVADDEDESESDDE